LVAIVPSTLTDPAAVMVERELSADEIAPAVALNPIAPLVWPPKESVNVPMLALLCGFLRRILHPFRCSQSH